MVHSHYDTTPLTSPNSAVLSVEMSTGICILPVQCILVKMFSILLLALHIRISACHVQFLKAWIFQNIMITTSSSYIITAVVCSWIAD